jgi:serine protease Do
MSRSLGFPLFSALLLSGFAVCQAQPAATIPAGQVAAMRSAQVAAARDAVMPYVVSIMVVREDHVQGKAQLSLGSGSGTIISADGHVATNAHVTENGQRFRVVLADKRELSAHLVGADELSDIAVLKIDEQREGGYAYANFAERNLLEAGDPVLAMGAPWGLEHSLSQGVVNHPARLMVSLFQDEADYEQQLGRNQPTARFYAWIQHDAAISPGNSGGPLVSLAGQIVGINTRGSFSGGDMAFAIPADVARRIVDQLVREGEVKRSYFGFAVRSLKSSGLDQGVLVSSVQQDSPADAAGLVPGDRIVRIDGAAVTVALPEQVPVFLRELTERPLGQKLQMDVLSGGRTRSLSMISQPYPRDLGDNVEIKAWGLTLTEVTPAIARSRLLEHQTGLIVTGVLPGKRAATAHPPLAVGDVVFAIDGKPVAVVADVEALGVSNGAGDSARVISFERSGKSMLSALDARAADSEPGKLRELPKPWVGIDAQPITATTSRLIEGPAGGGYRVTRVYPGPAQRADIRVGDLIVAVAGAAVPVSGDSDDEALQQRFRDALVDEPLALTIWRAGKELETELTPGIAPDPRGSLKSLSIDWLDLGVRALGFYDRIERRLDKAAQGVVVERVETGGLAGLANLKPGDVILKVDGKAVDGLDTFKLLTARSAHKEGRNISFLVLRAARTRLLFLDAGWEKSP